MISIHVLKQLILLYPAHILIVKILSAESTIAKFPIAGKHLIILLEAFGKVYNKDKWFSHLRCMLNNLTLPESVGN
ncbi:MAG: hypothetical protein ACTS73_03615 [Arsenophonus sp. NEOnobi-MAG3]